MDGKWAIKFRDSLRTHNPPQGLAEEVLREVRTATRDAGQSAETLFGPAEDYAASVAEERIGEQRRALVDLHGRTPGGILRRNTAMFLEWVAIVQLVRWLWLSEATLELSGRTALAFAVLGAAAIALIAVFPALRAAGRIPAAWYTAAGALIGIGLCIVLPNAFDMPTGATFPLPAFVTIASLLVLDLLWRLVPENAWERFTTRRLRGLDDTTWLRQLDALLRGRHGVPPSSAKSLVAEVRERVNASGVPVEDEFGPVEVHAHSLARSTPMGHRKARRQIALNCLFGAIALALVAIGLLRSEHLVIGLFGACLLFLVAHSALVWWQRGTGSKPDPQP